MGDPSKFISEAEKALKTCIISLKFKPDYDTAIENYTKAINIYLGSEKYEQATPLFEKIAEAHLALGSDFNSARNLAKAASYLIKIKNPKKATNFYDRAGLLYRQTGKNDIAVTMYKEAAENFETLEPLKAAEYFTIAAQVSASERAFVDASNYALSAASLYIKCSNLDDAEKMLRFNIRFNLESNIGSTMRIGNPAALCSKSVVSLIILKLLNGDVIAARKVEKEANENWGFRSTEEFHDISKLLGALETDDGTDALIAVNSNTLKHTHLEFAKLVKDIPLPKIQDSRISAQLAPNIPVTYNHGSTKEEEEDIC